jgi:Fic family protein
MLPQGNLMGYDPAIPYNDLPPLPPTVELETRAVMKACVEARVALAELRSAGTAIPNQDVLINTIPLLESQASNEIEDIVTTTDVLFQYAELDADAADPATKEALRYRTALRDGFYGLKERPLSVETAIRVCSHIKGVSMEIRRVPGTTLRNAASNETVYTPPVREPVLRDKLSNWAKFVHNENDDSLDPLVRMAVAHYQFEAIHPFTDGNGRTGRILNLLMLVSHDLLDQPVLYLSRYILSHRAEYYRGLQRVTAEGAWEEWVLFMLAAVTDTARWTTGKIKAIRALHRMTREYLRTVAPKLYRRELVDVLFLQPYCRIDSLVEANLVRRQAASLHLRQLVTLGVLRDFKVGRHRLFLNHRYLDLLLNESNDLRPFDLPVDTRSASLT